MLDEDGTSRFYFVVETKGTNAKQDLNPVERAKIDCGEAHFLALGVGGGSADSEYFAPVKDWSGFMNKMNAKMGR